jgi:hypothetical protein
MQCLGLVVLVCFVVGTSAEVFTSLASMERMLEAEHNVAHRIREYIQEEKKRLLAIDQ